jgi:hypothetical protein
VQLLETLISVMSAATLVASVQPSFLSQNSQPSGRIQVPESIENETGIMPTGLRTNIGWCRRRSLNQSVFEEKDRKRSPVFAQSVGTPRLDGDRVRGLVAPSSPGGSGLLDRVEDEPIDGEEPAREVSDAGRKGTQALLMALADISGID